MEADMPCIIVQTAPIFGRRPPGETKLVRHIRRRPMEATVYCNEHETVIDILPNDGFLVLNGKEITETPLIVTEGDLLIWIPGTLC